MAELCYSKTGHHFVLCLGPLNPPPGHCNFETGDCGYTEKKKAKKGHWLRIRGQTPTSYTGPKGDHTLGVGESDLCFSMKCFINPVVVMRCHTLSLSCSDFKATSCTLRHLTCYPSSQPNWCPLSWGVQVALSVWSSSTTCMAQALAPWASCCIRGTRRDCFGQDKENKVCPGWKPQWITSVTQGIGLETHSYSLSCWKMSLKNILSISKQPFDQWEDGTWSARKLMKCHFEDYRVTFFLHEKSHVSPNCLQIVFEAIRGSSVRSDIAIDDIVFKKGPCKGEWTKLFSTKMTIQCFLNIF